MTTITYQSTLPTVAGWYAWVQTIGDTPRVLRVSPQEDGSIKTRDPGGVGMLTKRSAVPQLTTATNGYWFGPLTDQVTFAQSNAPVAGTAITGTLSTTVMTTDLTSTDDDTYIGWTVLFTSGALAGEYGRVTDYDGTTKTLTITAVSDAPANEDAFLLIASPLPVTGAATATTLTVTTMSTDLGAEKDDLYVERWLVMTSGNTAGEYSRITDYAGTTKTLTFDALSEAPAEADTFIIV